MGQDRIVLRVMFAAHGGKQRYLYASGKIIIPSPKTLASVPPVCSELGLRAGYRPSYLMTLCHPYGREHPCYQRSACLMSHLSQQVGTAANFCVLDPEVTMISEWPLIHSKAGQWVGVYKSMGS